MRKLLRADFARVKKTKSFWAGIIVMAALGLIIVWIDYHNSVKYEIPFAEMYAALIFQSTIMLGIVYAVFCSLFSGTEYDHGTIRNKLMVGQSRTSIYLSNFVCCVTAGGIQAVVSVLTILAAGYLPAGRLDMSAGHFWKVSAVTLFLCVAYMSVYNLCSMLIASKSHASIVNILLAFSFMMFATYLFSQLNEPEMINDWSFTDGVMTAGDMVPNPNYISGRQRDIMQFLLDFFPGGQSYQIANYGTQEGILLHPLLFCFYSAAITVITNVTGIFLFRRKDIK